MNDRIGHRSLFRNYMETYCYLVTTLRLFATHFKSVVLRSMSLVFSAIACLVILAPSSAMAASQTLYSPGDPPAGYLANPGNNAGGLAWMLDNAVSSDINATTPGDYCNYYNTSGPNSMVHQNSLDQSSITGFTPSLPLSSWQEGDANNDSVCQAEQGTWT